MGQPLHAPVSFTFNNSVYHVDQLDIPAVGLQHGANLVHYLLDFLFHFRTFLFFVFGIFKPAVHSFHASFSLFACRIRVYLENIQSI